MLEIIISIIKISIILKDCLIQRREMRPRFLKKKNNHNVSINVYVVLIHSSSKCKNYHIFPLKVVDDEKTDHLEIILFYNCERSHYVYISNFSPLIRSKSTLHDHAVYFCKWCFSSFDQQNLKYKLNGQLALEQHKLIYWLHKPILPKMPNSDTTLQFKSWENAHRHPLKSMQTSRC